MQRYIKSNIFTFNHHQKLSHSYIPVMFSTIKTPISFASACKITRKAKPTIYTLARKGLIPAYKRGKKLYFYEDELLQWIESGRKQMQAMSLQEQAAEIVHGAKRKPKGGYNF